MAGPKVQDLQGSVIYVDVGTGDARPLRVSDFGGGAPPPFQSLTNATAAGPGTVWNPGGTFATWAMQVAYSGTPTALVVALDLSINGTDWSEAARWELGVNTSGDIISVYPIPATRARARVVTITGTGVSVSAWLAVV